MGKTAVVRWKSRLRMKYEKEGVANCTSESLSRNDFCMNVTLVMNFENEGIEHRITESSSSKAFRIFFFNECSSKYDFWVKGYELQVF